MADYDSTPDDPAVQQADDTTPAADDSTALADDTTAVDTPAQQDSAALDTPALDTTAQDVAVQDTTAAQDDVVMQHDDTAAQPRKDDAAPPAPPAPAGAESADEVAWAKAQAAKNAVQDTSAGEDTAAKDDAVQVTQHVDTTATPRKDEAETPATPAPAAPAPDAETADEVAWAKAQVAKNAQLAALQNKFEQTSIGHQFEASGAAAKAQEKAAELAKAHKPELEKLKNLGGAIGGLFGHHKS